MRWRKGETLVEFLMAMAIFGVLMTGVFEFIASQTRTLADFRSRDAIMFCVRKYIDEGRQGTFRYGNVEIASRDNILTGSTGGITMTFNLKP